MNRESYTSDLGNGYMCLLSLTLFYPPLQTRSAGGAPGGNPSLDDVCGMINGSDHKYGQNNRPGSRTAIS